MGGFHILIIVLSVSMNVDVLIYFELIFCVWGIHALEMRFLGPMGAPVLPFGETSVLFFTGHR